jgi:predicted GH43/DUF377 family glycosyl hydrolase
MERLKIGAGTPPILTKHGWLIVYHGVSELPVTEWRSSSVLLGRSDGALKAAPSPNSLSLGSAGVDADTSEERDGAVANVVFPTGIDRRDDLGTPDRFDVYYGMADNRIGVARLDLPERLPAGGVADAPEARV